MANENSDEPKIIGVRAGPGDIAGARSEKADQRGPLVAGATLLIEVEASSDAMFGLAVGGQHLAVAEWRGSGTFEVIVTDHYAPKMTIHVAIRGPRSAGGEISDWLGPVDDLRILAYDVMVADGSPAGCPAG